MSANVATVMVPTTEHMQHVVMSYVAQGFVVSTQTADTTTMFKKKEFNILWAVIGFFLCLLPLLIYCFVYATQKDQMVVVRVDGSHAPPVVLPFVTAGPQVGAAGGTVQWSEDRRYWWNGSTWMDVANTVPPGAVFSEDGRFWWDGLTWRPSSGPEEASASQKDQLGDAPATETAASAPDRMTDSDDPKASN